MTETFVAILANCPNRQYDAADASEAPIIATIVAPNPDYAHSL